MNYELAKELKEAGFMDSIDWIKTPFDDVVPNPTLSELIHACRDEFNGLDKDKSLSAGVVYWVGKAWSLDENTTGSTPEEAVARLWLALNKAK